MVSSRKPSTPRSSQKRVMSSSASWTWPVVEVQIRLFGQEVVHEILLAAGVPLPGGAAEDRQPIVGRRAVRLGVGPHIPVGLGVGAARPALLEPRMLVGSVRDHLVDHHLEAEPVRLGDKGVEIGERAEHRVDVAIVRDVVAEVLHRRLAERRDPDRVGAKPGDIGQAADDALEVADAVPVGVLVAARIDLVDHRAAPPVAIRRRVREISTSRAAFCIDQPPFTEPASRPRTK